MIKQWHVLEPDFDLIGRLSKALHFQNATATVLVNRNIRTPDDARRFIKAPLSDLRPPFLIKDMEVAVRRIYAALTDAEKILIFSDYDVDGITSTVLLLEFFRQIGTDVSYYIPNRMHEGYGLQSSHITEYALPNQIDLIITADCGMGSHTAIEAARDQGIDVIVTDHHKPSHRLPPAVAVINPNRIDCTAGFEELAGVGVAYTLLICLRKYLRQKGFWQNRPEPNLIHFCDLVALGTIADMVPLRSENRIFVKAGLDKINSSPRIGITAMRASSGTHKDFLTAEDVAFQIAPRLNAPGRMEHAAAAVDLLLSNNLTEATRFGKTINQMNIVRRETEQKILEDISNYLSQNRFILKRRSLILSEKSWHEGVLGIVASRLVKRYFRPVGLISIKDGMGKGSARSIPGLDLHKALAAVSDHLEKFGGHAMAAGFTINPDKIESFKTKFEQTVKEMTRAEDFTPKLIIDCELNFDQISATLVNEIESLEPFGSGNREPLFTANAIKVVSEKIVGQNHRRMQLAQSPSGKRFNAIQFNVDPTQPLPSLFDRIAYRIRWNRWNGRQILQIIIEDNQ